MNILLGKEGDLPVTKILSCVNLQIQTNLNKKERKSMTMAYLLSTFKVETNISLVYKIMTNN